MFQDGFFDYVMSGAKGTKMPRGDKTHIMLYQIPRFSETQLLKFIEYNKISFGEGGRMRSLSRVSRKQRYNTLDFPRESRVPRKALPSFGNLPPRGTLFPSRLPLPTWMLLAPIGWTQSQRGFAPLDTSPVRAVAIYPALAQWCPHTRTEKTRHENPPRIRVNFRAWFIVYDAVI